MAYTYKSYKESDDVKKARELIAQAEAAKPGEYQSQYSQQIKQAQEGILNRPKFQYDLATDGLYRQYKDQAVRQGKMAMMDTMGQAAAMTGGYGSSYGQSVGQQAYQGYLQQLNDKVPELYKLAMDKYSMEGSDMLQKYGLLTDAENQDYGRYQDALGNWRNDLQYATGRFDTSQDVALNKYFNDRNYDLTTHNKEQANAQKQADALIANGKMPSDKILKKAGYSQSFAKKMIDVWNAKNAPAAGNSAGGGGGGGGDGLTAMQRAMLAAQGRDAGATEAQIKKALQAQGVSAADAEKAITNSSKITLGGGQFSSRSSR